MYTSLPWAMSQDVLEYGGKFYVVGSGRQPLQKDKTVTEDYYLLTLAAIRHLLNGDGIGDALVAEGHRLAVPEQVASKQSGLDAHAMPAIFLGGGAALLKRHVGATDGLCRPLILDDAGCPAASDPPSSPRCPPR